MDKNKNLEQFFRNRVNELDANEADWDRPDASVFRNAQAEFPKYPIKKERDWKPMIILFLAALLLGALSIGFYFNNKAIKLEQQLHIAQTEIKNIDQQLNNLSNKHKNEITTLKLQNNISNQLKDQNVNFKTTKQANKNSTSKITTPKKPVTASTTSNANSVKTTPSINTKTQATINKNTKQHLDVTQKVTTIKPATSPATTLSKATLPSLMFDKFDQTNKKAIKNIDQLSSVKVLKPRKTKRFGVGLFFNALNFKTSTDYKLTKEIEQKTTTTAHQAYAPSIQFAYAITPNLWISTGFRKANINVNQRFSTALYYDKSTEYIDDFGKTYNSLSINESDSDVPSELSFEIPAATNIEDKELYYAQWNHIRDFSWTQIPIGINYYQGKKNLQWFAKGGFGWNLISGSETYEDANFIYKDEDLTIKDEGFLKQSEQLNTQFMSGHAGLGLNYQLTKNWQVRTSFTLERNFTKNKKVFNIENTNQHLQAGIAYKW